MKTTYTLNVPDTKVQILPISLTIIDNLIFGMVETVFTVGDKEVAAEIEVSFNREDGTFFFSPQRTCGFSESEREEEEVNVFLIRNSGAITKTLEEMFEIPPSN